ncbi:hypothetical protein [Bosea sp. (in: a-proteobacteria)]|uniref:hypothetical protein n=1 Tax=Bosea sp. (in: a-proteobacteria) TaxID=1871050 RepID=UPI0025B8D98D|nr:hypothetical protein [Bosea sp. (in: a-proteobacteria)]MBR3190855.1 hypothetical protein [Bosea sp. (in: a-proteobacteria)]
MSLDPHHVTFARVQPGAEKHPIGLEPEGFIGLRDAMSRAEVRAAEDEAGLDAVAERRTRITLFDAFYRAKHENGDPSFDSADLTTLDQLQAEAKRLTERRRRRERIL